MVVRQILSRVDGLHRDGQNFDAWPAAMASRPSRLVFSGSFPMLALMPISQKDAMLMWMSFAESPIKPRTLGGRSSVPSTNQRNVWVSMRYFIRSCQVDNPQTRRPPALRVDH